MRYKDQAERMKPIIFKAKPALDEQLKELSSKTGYSKAQIIRKAVEAYIQREVA